MKISLKRNKKLPLLISVPHGGNDIPVEVKEITSLTKKDIFRDGDALTRKIYALKDKVIAYIDTPIARAFIDLNRAPSDLPPDNPDGVIKTITVDQTEVYKPGLFPDKKTIAALLEKYYYPYHNKIDSLQASKNIILALDCHSMSEKAPEIDKNPGQERPLICLSNRGDQYGKAMNDQTPVTCPPQWINLLAKCFRKTFVNEQGEININDPFTGGFITQSHFSSIIPWIQVEINRKLYLSPPYFNEDKLTVKPERISELRNKIFTTLKLFITGL